jgi:phosphate transport system substrate-binding protein
MDFHGDVAHCKETTMKRLLPLTILGLALIGIGCNGKPTSKVTSGGTSSSTQTSPPKEMTGEIKADGSSTVFLITRSMAKEYNKLHPKVNITVGVSGTGGGFKKFAAGETDVQDASRAIKDAEKKLCEEKNLKYTELQIAWDGLAVVINKENTWAAKMTVAQLKKIWHPDTAAKTWKDVDPSWPDAKIDLFGAGTDSGTFDYFTEAINGKEKVTRPDYQASEDDNIIVKGVSENKHALGYFGVAYYEQNKAKLQAVAIAFKDGDPYVLPTKEDVLTNKYKPLSRPLFIYVKDASLKRPEVLDFVKFYQRRNDLVGASGYVELSAEQSFVQQEKLEKALKELK